MKSALISNNTRLIVALFVLLTGLQMVMYFVGAVQGGDVPMGRMALGVIVFGVLAIYYVNNNLWPRITENRWITVFCFYIAFSFAYGYLRFRTPTASVFDLWFFAFIPAILLVPPFSFNVRVFDRILASGVILSVLSVLVALAAFPDVLYDRKLFSNYVSQLAVIGAGAGYLLLKYAERPNALMVIGLIGVLTDGVVYGVGGAFRGRLILAILLLLLFLFILFRSRRAGFTFKFLGASGAAVAVVSAIFLASTRMDDQVDAVSGRFESIQKRYEETGDVIASDARLAEYQYFMALNPAWKLILGHGVGGLWYDYHGMFEEGESGGMAGARSMLHINWLHLAFKIGIVGLFLLVGMLVSHFRKHRVFIRQNWGWWTFVIYYLAWSTYYGDKVLGLRSIVFLIVLIHPWIFKLPQVKPQPNPRRPGLNTGFHRISRRVPRSIPHGVR